MLKMCEDSLIGPLLSDDNIVVAGETQKYYARAEPQTIIHIQELDDAAQIR